MDSILHLDNLPEFDRHKFVSIIRAPKCNLYGIIAIHRGTPKNPAFGATRWWNYPSDLDALKDVLKLSRTMSYKAAMAGLPYGGAKGVIVGPQFTGEKRTKLLQAYAKRVNFLSGNFITGADVGIDEQDVKVMKKLCPSMVGVQDNPVKHTAYGLRYSLEECMEEVFGSEELDGHSFAIQGLGKVGSEFLSLIYSKDRTIYVSDINSSQVEKMKEKYPTIIPVDPSEIHTLKVDVFSPCALGGVLNSTTVNELQCRMVVGAANSQLESETIGAQLYKREILYAPDYVVNAGGLISVAYEYQHEQYDENKVMEKVRGIKCTLRNILTTSRLKNKAPNLVSNKMAEAIFNSYI